jgi:hypothetical protein
MGNRYADHMFRCAHRLLYRIALGLGWRSQLSHEPTVGLSGFHWIDQIDRSLMVVIALEAFERPDIKAGWAGVHTYQHGCGLVLWTRRPVKRDHDALLQIRRERKELSVTGRYRQRGGDETSMEPSLSRGCAVLLTFEKLMNWQSRVSEAIGAFHSTTSPEFAPT